VAKAERGNELIALRDNFKLWNHSLDGIVGFSFLYHVASEVEGCCKNQTIDGERKI